MLVLNALIMWWNNWVFVYFASAMWMQLNTLESYLKKESIRDGIFLSLRSFSEWLFYRKPPVDYFWVAYSVIIISTTHRHILFFQIAWTSLLLGRYLTLSCVMLKNGQFCVWIIHNGHFSTLCMKGQRGW